MKENSPQNGKNRGKSSEDEALFGNPKQLKNLEMALEDMYYLLSRGYAVRSALVLVGNRHRLRTRQILALQGMSCSAEEVLNRQENELRPEQIRGKTLYLDGFNILILLETLLSGGYIFRGLDGCYRDISSVHGTYKRVKHTEGVLMAIGRALQGLGAEKAVLVFDAPVSNSGRLRALCCKIAQVNGFAWEVLLDNAPDKYLVQQGRAVCTADAWVLNHCTEWFNLGKYIINSLYGEDKPATVICFEV
jgi:hypothetical protein